MTPRPVIVLIPPTGSHQQRQEHESAEAGLRHQELETRYADDGWACYDVPPEPLPELADLLTLAVTITLPLGVCLWLAYMERPSGGRRFWMS